MDIIEDNSNSGSEARQNEIVLTSTRQRATVLDKLLSSSELLQLLKTEQSIGRVN